MHCFRLHRGADLLQSIQAFAAAHSCDAAVAVACVGCLSAWRVRGADGQTAFCGEERVEIVSLTGTIGPDGAHLHISLARENLSVFGGHLLPGCIVNTTAEIVLQALQGVRFRRQPDPETGYRELRIEDA